MAKTFQKEYYPGIGKIKFEGRESKNPLAFRWYDPEQVVSGKKMKDHLRFAIAYWHSFCGDGSDQFGSPTHFYPWDSVADNDEKIKMRLDAAFEFFTKIGTGYYCFHDVDVVGNGSVLEIEKRLEQILPVMKTMQQQTGVKLLWGTANLFSH
ncbi:MAG TPA: xylose isomerase, partial [Bacteroidales bacterium]|nr:xylose isomerase [Bacteroidales bacterium]